MAEMSYEAAVIAANTENPKEAQLDACVKQVLKLKEVIARILKHVIPEFTSLDIETIIREHLVEEPSITESVSPYPSNPVIVDDGNEDRVHGESNVNYDVKCRVRLKPGSTADCFIIVDLEPQKQFQLGYSLVRRAIYYCSRMISSQIKKLSKDEKYDALSKVYSIWICFDPTAGKENCITRISLAQAQEYGDFAFPAEQVDMMDMVFVMLGKQECENLLLSFLNILFSKDLPVKDRFRKLEEQGFPVTRDEVKEVVEAMTSVERSFYDSKFREGRESGLVEGREEGREEGRVGSLCSLVYKKLLGFSDAVKESGLSEQDFLGWMNKLHPDYRV